jgi:hypothetical protein
VSDVNEFAEQPVASDYQQLAALAKMQLQAQAQVQELEQQLKQANEALNNIQTVLLPEQMERCRLEEVTVEGGIKIKVQRKLHASIPHPPSSKQHDPHKWREAIDWCEKNAPAIVKYAFEVQLGMKQTEKAKELRQALERFGVMFKEGQQVPWQSLTKVVEAWAAGGKPVPEELLGVREIKRALIETTNDD